MGRVLEIGLVVGLLALVGASAGAQDDSAARVMALLYAYETPGNAAWKDLDPSTVGLLAQVYQNPSSPKFVRLRAVGASGNFSTNASRTFLRAVASAKGQQAIFQRRAIFALERAFGDKALEDIRPFLESKSVDVREAAAVSIAQMRGAKAKRTLDQHIAAEKSLVVREAASKAQRDR